MTDILTATVKGIVRNIVAAFSTPNTEQQLALLAHGQLAVAGVHGDYFETALRNKLFSFNVTAVTIPQIASGLVSVFTLYNPPGSGVVGELVRTTIGQVVATTVVDAVGWYSSSAALTALGTFTTIAQARSSQMQAPAANAIKPYSAYTHSGTPIREDIVGSFGATTDAGLALPDKQHNGTVLLPPGVAMSLAMSTAVGTTSGLDAQAIWAEWPNA